MATWKHDSLEWGCLILVLAAGLDFSSYTLAASEVSSANPSATTTQMIVDMYSDQGGQGQNKTMGSYTIGDTVKFYIYTSSNSTIQEIIVAPDGSSWLRMAGPVNSGTIIDYFETQYPTGKWAISVKAQAGNITVSDTAFFEVVDKQQYVCTKTSLLNTSGILERRDSPAK